MKDLEIYIESADWAPLNLKLLFRLPLDYCCPECAREIFSNPHGREFPKLEFDGEFGHLSCYCGNLIEHAFTDNPGVLIVSALKIIESGSGVLVQLKEGEDIVSIKMQPAKLGKLIRKRATKKLKHPDCILI